MDGLHYQKGEVWIFFIFALPILQGLNVMLLIHILAALPQLLIVNNIDVGTLFTHVLHSSRVVLQTLYYQFLVNLLFKAEGQQRDLLVGQEVLDIPVGFLPLFLAVSFEEDPFLWVRDVDLVSELTLLHRFEDRHVADCGVKGRDVEALLVLVGVVAVHRLQFRVI